MRTITENLHKLLHKNHANFTQKLQKRNEPSDN
jgi:hypothetical protein